MFFKKKKKVVFENNKYNIGNTVNFRYEGDLKVGIIVDISQNENKEFSYEINVGGECPYTVRIKEEKIIRILK